MNKTRIIAVLILILNAFFFLPETVDILKTNGGGMGFGWLILPFVIFLNSFVVPALLSFTKKFKESNAIFWINQVGIICSFLCFGYALRSNGY
jgi:hypothetical protein